MLRKFWLVPAMFLLAATAGAQPFTFGGASSSNFWVEPAVDAQGYYYRVSYRGDPPEVTADIVRGMVVITVGQSSGGPGAFFHNRMSHSFPLAPDADAMRMARREAPGLVVFGIPRRMPMMAPPWPR